MASVGQNIIKLRADQRMKQKDLCEKTGLIQRYVSSLERGKVDPRLSALCKIAKAFGVSVSVLLQDVEDVKIEQESAEAA